MYLFFPQYQENGQQERRETGAGKFSSKRLLSAQNRTTHSTVQYIVNEFKYTGSIKNVSRKPKRRILSAREERYVIIKYEKILDWVSQNCEELLKILQGKLCVTK